MIVTTKQLDNWERIIKAYNPDKQSLAEYCKKANISKSSFYHYKKMLNSNSSSFMPCNVVNVKDDKLSFEVNNIAIKVSPSIDDDSLRRIIGICKSL